MTYSVVARDTKTGRLWIAVQTHWFGVGNNVPWLESWVWAIATQAQTNMDYGKKWLELLKDWLSPEDVFKKIAESDNAIESRQVAIIDTQGNIFAHTGKQCVDVSGYLIWDNFVVQWNILTNKNVLPAMKKAYEENMERDFAIRLMETLHAWQDAGGELRWQQSAALRIVSWEKNAYDIINLRIDNDPEPLKKMWWQLDMSVAYKALMQAEEEWEAWNIEMSLKLFDKFSHIMGDTEEGLFWKAFMLMNNWRLKEAEQIFKQFPENSQWQELRKRIS